MKQLPKWAWPVFSIELRKILTYRSDFWINFLGILFTHLLVAYFLWKAIYTFKNVTELGGYSFQAMMFYYLLVPIVDRMVRSEEMGFMSTDIYEGSLNRYLLYPVSFFGFKYLAHLTFAVVTLLQLFLAIAIFYWGWGFPEGMVITLTTVTLSILTIYLGNYLFFAMASIFEMVAFWADNIWSLQVLLRFTILFLGGGLIPLSLFPDHVQALLQFLPFSYLISFPIKIFMGHVSFSMWLEGLAVMTLWSVVFTVLSRWVWHSGTKQYSGIGI